jgi:hypothetical protein
VDLAGHPLPLVLHPGRAGPGQQLPLQAGVLAQRRDQPVVGGPGLGQRRLPLEFVALADSQKPRQPTHRHRVGEQDRGVPGQAGRRADVDPGGLGGAGDHGRPGDEVQLGRPPDDPEGVEIADGAVETEPRVDQDQDQRDQQQAGQEDAHHPGPGPPARAQRVHHQDPERGQRAQRQLHQQRSELVVVDHHGERGEDREQHVRHDGGERCQPAFPVVRHPARHRHQVRSRRRAMRSLTRQ